MIFLEASQQWEKVFGLKMELSQAINVLTVTKTAAT